MVPKGLLVKPETWRVASEDGRLIFVDQTSGRPLEAESEEKQIAVMHGMGLWQLLRYRLEITNGRLLNRVMAQSNQASTESKIVDMNHSALALTIPSHDAVMALLHRERQINMWKKAA